MKIRMQALSILLVALLAACGAQQSAPPAAPTLVVAAPVAVEPTIAPPLTPAFEPADDTAPTVVAETVGGVLDWRDALLRSDGVTISVSGLAQPAAGEAYVAWLANGEGSLPIGALRIDGAEAQLSYDSPEQLNLLGAYERVYIARGAEGGTAENAGVVLSGALPPQALIHIRHLLSGIGATPGGVGFAVGLRAQSDELLRHAQFLRDAFQTGDLALERAHAEHIINIIRGSEARDANGDGEAQNPGDGFGLLPNGQQDGYIKGMVDHARLAAEAGDASEPIRLHAGHVQAAGENVRERVEQIRALAEQIVAAGDLAATRQDVLALLTLAEQTIQGVDADRDEQVEPVAGEGGVNTAYQHAQLMAGIVFGPAGGTVAAPAAHGGDHATAAAPTAAAPTAGAVAPAAPVGAATVEIGDNTFGPAEITVPAGTTITWRQSGQRPHTVTAEDGSFKSGTLNTGDSFSHTFDTPGSYRYICEFHEGMAAVVIVTAAASAAPTAVAPPPAAAEVAVAMLDFEFTPQEIRVPAGTTLLWRNDGQKQHSATAVDGSFDTGLFGAGEERSVTLATPGTYLYYCVLHAPADGSSGMVGTVIVE